MKKLFFVFTAAAVLLTLNKLTLTDDNHISAAPRGIINALPLIDKECQDIIGSPMIPPDAKRVVIEITTEELLLPPGVFWIFDERRKTRIKCLNSFTFVPLPEGVYILYSIPEIIPRMEKKMLKKI